MYAAFCKVVTISHSFCALQVTQTLGLKQLGQRKDSVKNPHKSPFTENSICYMISLLTLRHVFQKPIVP